MGYKFREVKCPLCDRKFMWNYGTFEDSQYEYYLIKGTDERVGKVKCTTCGTYLAVFDGELEGVLPEVRKDLIPMREYGI